MRREFMQAGLGLLLVGNIGAAVFAGVTAYEVNDLMRHGSTRSQTGPLAAVINPGVLLEVERDALAALVAVEVLAATAIAATMAGANALDEKK